jgi:ferritin
MTVEFMNWFLNEQKEEEYIARRALELFDVIGEEGTGRWEIDREITKIKYEG